MQLQVLYMTAAVLNGFIFIGISALNLEINYWQLPPNQSQ